MQRKFDVFGLTDYTDAVLIGGYSKDKPEPTDDDPTPKWIDKKDDIKTELQKEKLKAHLDKLRAAANISLKD